MSIKKTPFIRYDDSEDYKPKTFTVRMNQEEEAMINELKVLLNIKSNGKALKIGARVAINVLHGTFGDKVLRYLFKKDR